MEKLKLYSLATPNGQKVSIALEEMEIPYEATTINIMKGDQFTDEFIAINPNSKIPALIDPIGDKGQSLAIMESGAILLYLAEKTEKFLPKESAARSRTLQWLFFQMGGVGPMFGQFGHFYKYAKDKCDHPYPVERYSKETQRLLDVIETKLNQTNFIAGNDYTIADMSIAPWVMCLEKHYDAKEALQLNRFKKINNWLKGLMERPAFQKGLEVCGF
jgi:GST-like protein